MTTPNKKGVIEAVTNKTKVVALITLVVEALFLIGASLLPVEHRIYAFCICGLLIFAALVGIFYIEALEARSQGDRTLSTDNLTDDLKTRALVITEYVQNAEGEIAAKYRTATALKFVGRYEEALRHYEAILREEESHILAKYNVASCLLYLERWGDAKEIYCQVIDLLSRNKWKGNEEKTRIYHGALMQLYCIAEHDQDFSAGEKYLLTSLEILPDDCLSYLNLVICSLKAGNLDEARKWYKVLMDHPDRIAALSDLDATDKDLLDQINKNTGIDEN